ncbi:hypothetical protein BpHYR1_052398 [Brachionus plicatilis]|uniref:Uncharacterized protein n=1 Tax=Brachionus plicatilis TaxID=10195 RepID=A0A3M7PZC5_BRAPC|nr:hypothetical protein BpHYR1_052398 [Brachionus plicatilis]
MMKFKKKFKILIGKILNFLNFFTKSVNFKLILLNIEFLNVANLNIGLFTTKLFISLVQPDAHYYLNYNPNFLTKDCILPIFYAVMLFKTD